MTDLLKKYEKKIWKEDVRLTKTESKTITGRSSSGRGSVEGWMKKGQLSLGELLYL